MPTELEAFAHAAGLVIYLDTSAVLPIALNLAGNLPALERRRHTRLTDFLAKVVPAGSRSACSILVLEEIAAKVRGKMQKDILMKARADSWKDYETADPTAAANDRRTIQAHVLKVLEHAVNGLAKVGTTVEQPVVDDAVAGGRKVRKAHRELLRVYSNIDSMDALHVVFGGLLGCKHFISFDHAWAGIAEIEVLA
jgi:hypothetical protein